MFFNGTESRAELIGLGGTGSLPPANLSVRIYPSGPQLSEGNATTYSFRAIPLRLPGARTRAGAEGGVGLFENACLNWLSVDFQTGLDGIHGIDEFVLKTVDGRLQSVTYRTSNITMERVNP
jgi:hypothetical protein